jgi:hypothetical protein
MSHGFDFESLKQIFERRSYLLTAHASARAVERDIDSSEIEEAVIGGEVIESYPDDKYSPSCLILGVTQNGRVLHIHVSYPPDVKVITVYQPAPEAWETDWKTRKST